MGVQFLIFAGFLVLSSFYQAQVSALDLGIRQKRGSCGGEYVGKHGVIESQNYPSYYPGYSNCIWTIRATKGARITLRFISFQLESSSSCQFDALEVRDGALTSSDLLGKFCGSVIPEPIESSSSTVTLKFRSDGSGQYRGFKIEFESGVSCGGELFSDQGDLTSPDYPRNYEDNAHCTWTITVPPNYQVMLRFRSFQVEQSHNCESDYLEIHDGSNAHFPVMGRYCGFQRMNDIVSSSKSLTVVFVSDASENYRGFSAQYSKVNSNIKVALSTATENVPVLSMVGTIVCFIFFAYM